jgi:hypothetical protein
MARQGVGPAFLACAAIPGTAIGLGCLLLAASAAPALMAAELPAPRPGRVDMAITGEGGDVQVRLAALLASLVGFEGPPSTAGEREALRLTRENLKTGDGLVRFSTRAACRLTSVEVDMTPPGEGSDPAHARTVSASYRFACDQPALLESAAVGLFVGFPALERVFVRYRLDGIRGDAELNRGRLAVTFVPLY